MEEQKGDEKKEGDQFDAEAEVKTIISSNPWNFKVFNDVLRSDFKEHEYQFRATARKLLGKSKEEAEGLDDFLYLNKEDSEAQLFMIAYNNALEDKNSKRVERVKAGKHIDCLNYLVAKEQLEELLKDKLVNWAKNEEKQFASSFKKDCHDLMMQKILLASNVFTSAAVIMEFKMFMGRGEFQKILDFIIISDLHTIPDLANKLLLLKQGILIHQDLQMPINS